MGNANAAFGGLVYFEFQSPRTNEISEIHSAGALQSIYLIHSDTPLSVRANYSQR